MAVGGRLRQRLTLAVACTAQVMMVLDVLIVSVALPSLQHELHLSPAGLEWVVSAYALALAALIPTGGALGDHFGRKRVFMSGVAVFTLASAGCALSVSGGMLIGFRVIQGIGGAVMSSLTLSLITEAYPPEARTGPIGLWAAVSGLAVAGGSVVGGLLLSVFPWSSIFWVNVPIGVVTVVISAVAVAESREPVPRPFDIGGVALSASGLLLPDLRVRRLLRRRPGIRRWWPSASPPAWRSWWSSLCGSAGPRPRWSRRRCCEPRASAGRVPCTCWPTLRSRDSSTTSRSSSRTLTDGPRCAPACPGFSSAFRTLLVAQLGKRVERRLPVASAVGWGCLIAAAGVLGMSQLTTATPFAWPAACYVLVGVGFALMVPAGSIRGDGRGSRGIVGDRVRPVQCLPPDRHHDGTGHPGIHRRQRDPGRLAPAVPDLSRQPSGSSAAQAGADVAGGQVHVVAASAGQLALDPAVCLLPQRFRARPAAGRRDPGCGWRSWASWAYGTSPALRPGHAASKLSNAGDVPWSGVSPRP